MAKKKKKKRKKKRIHVSMGERPHDLLKRMAEEEGRTLQKMADLTVEEYYDYRKFLKETRQAKEGVV